MGETLDDQPFSYLAGKDGRLAIGWRGRVVTTLKGDDAAALLTRLRGAAAPEIQLLLAKATGNFKRGNERRAHR